MLVCVRRTPGDCAHEPGVENPWRFNPSPKFPCVYLAQTFVRMTDNHLTIHHGNMR